MELGCSLGIALAVTHQFYQAQNNSTCSQQQLVGILDAGSQFGKVIDRRVRELLVESELIDFNTPADELQRFTCLIISGGPDSVFSPTAPKYDPKIFDLGIPILGICYGLQLMVHLANGKIESKETREDGQFKIRQERHCNSALFRGLEETQQVLLTHGDSVVDPGEGLVVTSRSENGVIASVENVEKKLYGVQFHPEVDLTENGVQILSNFLFDISGCMPSFTIEDRETTAIREILETVKDKKVLSLVSGGVDSSVCSALLRKALPPDQILAVHIDHGFMRHEESSSVKKALADVGVYCTVIQAQKRFAEATTVINDSKTEPLQDAVKPEVKRKIIGDTFMHVAEEFCQSHGLTLENVILAQGTLRPDLIESASKIANAGKTAEVIKTHHNDTQLVRDLRDKGCVIEPLKDYHKDEVRLLGKQLGLPENLVMRQPFPGPGLAIRVICADCPLPAENLEATLLALDSFSEDNPHVAFALHAFRTVGVQGDGRSYKNLVSLSFRRSRTETNVSWQRLFDIAKEIPRKVHSVNRIIFAAGDPLEGHEDTVTPTTLQPKILALLREADRIVNEVLVRYKLHRSLSQVPVILFPSDFGNAGDRGVCIRTFMTNDFMTGVPAVLGTHFPLEAWSEIVSRVTKIDGIGRVCYDLTPKPPGTTEWE